jgi:hypothetical protein
MGIPKVDVRGGSNTKGPLFIEVGLSDFGFSNCRQTIGVLVGQSNGTEVAYMLTNRPISSAFACITAVTFAPMRSARAWGDEGHETIALMPGHYLTPAAKA